MTAINVADRDFSDLLKNNKIVLVDFWAEWCGPCRQLSPIVDQAALDFKDKIVVAKSNIDQDGIPAQQNGVRGIPTMILFKDGKPVSTKIGAITKQQLTDWLNDNL